MRLSAELLSPFSISRNRQSKSPETLNFIPGSTLRGVLAQRYLALREKGELFSELFLNEHVHFPNLYPSSEAGAISSPMPLSARSCKRFPGFKEEDANQHGIVDVLFAYAAAELYQEEKHCLPVKELQDYETCGYTDRTIPCDEPLPPTKGFWNGDCSEPEEIKPAFRIDMHTGIERATGTVRNKILFGIEAVENIYYRKKSMNKPLPLYMNGRARWEGHVLESLQPLMEEEFFVGKARSRGRGNIRLSLGEGNPPETTKDTLHSASNSFRDFCRTFLKLDVKGIFFTLTCMSDVICLDRFLRYQPALPLDLKDCRELYRIADVTVVRGWNAIQGLPKEDEQALSLGSAFLYQYLGSDVNELLCHLNLLEREGIGIRKNEGFGGLEVNHPFHYEFSKRGIS